MAWGPLSIGVSSATRFPVGNQKEKQRTVFIQTACLRQPVNREMHKRCWAQTEECHRVVNWNEELIRPQRGGP